MKSVLQDWVMEIGLRHQGVLMSAVRGCDTLPKHHVMKTITRALRCDTLVSFSPNPSSFFKPVSHEQFVDLLPAVREGIDELPYHYVVRLLHAAQVLGFHHPLIERRTCWNMLYLSIVKWMHLNPETSAELDARLNADEATFAADQ